MKILSLFSGIGGFDKAFEDIFGTEHEVYFSEIDSYAIKVYKQHFPNAIEMGSITDINIDKLPHFDLIMGGSPCQDLSIANKNRQGLDGSRSGLFWKFVEIIKNNKPKYFILENVNSMSKEAKEIITKELGVEAIMINASLVSAQNRKRLFWVGKLVGDTYVKVEISQPKDKGILLKDILEKDVDEKYYLSNKEIIYMNGNSGKYSNRWSYCNDNHKEKSITLVSNLYKGVPYNTIRIGQIGKGGQADRIYSSNGKSINLSANGGGRGAKTGLYVVNQISDKIKNIMTTQNSIIRKLTPIECARLQCFPDDWCSELSNTRQYKGYGNAVNVEVIKHILSFLAIYDR